MVQKIIHVTGQITAYKKNQNGFLHYKKMLSHL